MIRYHEPQAERVLEIAIYRCTEDQHYQEQEGRFQSASAYFRQAMCALGKNPETSQDLSDYRQEWLQREGFPWDFNQIVGWIRLYAWPGNIAAYLFFACERITKVMRRKRFITRRGKFMEMRVYPEHTNEEILASLRKTILDAAASNSRLRRLYVDIDVLDVLGPHIDWLGLTKTQMQKPVFEKERFWAEVADAQKLSSV